MKLGIIGIGVVGGATKKVLEKKHQIFSYDKYKSPFNTPKALTDLVINSEAVFLCVPTPMEASGKIDYSSVHNSLKSIKEKTEEIERDYKDFLIVIRSTAVSGSTDRFAEEYPFRFAFNPEFLREKHALEDMENTSRVIIGANNLEDSKVLKGIYHSIFPEAKYVSVNCKTAEMIKYAANVVLTGQVAIANEIYQVCHSLGVDYDIVKEAILLDDRIGTNIDVPGPDGQLGFGGKCFPKDLNALIYLARENMYRPYLLEEMWRLNEKVREDKDWLDIEGAVSEKNYEEN
jgi:UDPglucose 6-dehydrogenase